MRILFPKLTVDPESISSPAIDLWPFDWPLMVFDAACEKRQSPELMGILIVSYNGRLYSANIGHVKEITYKQVVVLIMMAPITSCSGQ